MKIFSKQNVFDAAMDRIRWVFDEFEQVGVSFSGGKDSTVTLELTLRVAEEKGRLPVPVVFIDQEAEWTTTIDYVREVMHRPQVKNQWLQVPIKIFNATSTIDEWLMCWEEGKEWGRPKEPDSIHENIYGTDRFKQLFRNYANVTYPKDVRFADLGGVRAEESPTRTMGLTTDPTYKHITWGKRNNDARTHFTFYPLYDWSYTDIWGAIHREGWEYNRHYDYLYMYNHPLATMRVSNVHHEMAVRSLFHLQEIDPTLYNALTKRIGGIDTAGKLNKADFFIKELPYMFSGWEEYRDFLVDKLVKPEHQEKFRSKFHDTAYRYHGTSCYEALLKKQVTSVITNDYHFTNLDQWLARPNSALKHLIKQGERPTHMDEFWPPKPRSKKQKEAFANGTGFYKEGKYAGMEAEAQSGNGPAEGPAEHS